MQCMFCSACCTIPAASATIDSQALSAKDELPPEPLVQTAEIGTSKWTATYKIQDRHLTFETFKNNVTSETLPIAPDIFKLILGDRILNSHEMEIAGKLQRQIIPANPSASRLADKLGGELLTVRFIDINHNDFGTGIGKSLGIDRKTAIKAYEFRL